MISFILFGSGFLAVIAQTLLLREMLALFAGNELSIGIIFALWLSGSALGSYVSARPRVAARFPPQTALAASFVLTGLCLVLSFLFIRGFRPLLHIFPGEGIPLSAIIPGAACVFLPLGFLAGAQFSFGARSLPPARAYLLESLGYLAGGIVFTFGLSLFPGPAPLTLAVCLLNLLCAGTLLGSRLLLSGVIIGTLLLPLAGPAFEKTTLALAFPGREVHDFAYSPYGQHVAATANGELTLYSDGVPEVTFPDSGIAETEEFVYLPLLFAPRPRNVLLIGGAGKYLPVLLQHRLDRITAVEQDARFRELLEKNAPAAFNALLADPRLHFVSADGRRFLARSGERYDVVLLGLPYPATLSLNRLYTAEFFSLVKKHLAPGGVFALSLPGSSVYLDAPREALNRVAYATLRRAFASVRLVPGDTTLYVASDRPLAPPGVIKRRFVRRAPPALFVSPSFLDYALDRTREQEYTGSFAAPAAGEIAGTNRDFAPQGMLASLLVWQSVFAHGSAAAYAFLVRYSFLAWLLLFLYLVLGKNGATGTAATSGTAGMGLQMLSVWGLGVTAGNVYQWIGLLSACFMGGLSLGSFAALRYFSGEKNGRMIRLAEIIFCLWTLLFFLPGIVPLPAGAYLLLSAGTGILLGLEFSLLTAFPAPGGAAKLYAADLAGGVFAALVFGTLCIPAWGFAQTILFILLLKAVSAGWWLRQPA